MQVLSGAQLSKLGVFFDWKVPKTVVNEGNNLNAIIFPKFQTQLNMLRQFVFPYEPQPLHHYPLGSPALSQDSSCSEKILLVDAFPGHLLQKHRESHHRNWQAIEESIVEWFSGKHIQRGEPETIQEDFMHERRRSIKQGEQTHGVSQVCNLSVRKLSRKINSSI